MNPDGKTFNALRLMSWLSEIVSPGRGLSVEECRELAQENINRRKARKQSDGK